MDKSSSRILTAKQILDADDIEEREVYVPQWKGSVMIRTLTQKQSGSIRRQATDKRTGVIDSELLESLLFVECVVDPVFTMADYGKLQDKSMAAVSLVLREILQASGMTEEAVKDATKSLADEPYAALRVLPGEGTEEDAG